MELLVYTAFWCPDCRTAKRFLEKNNIPYQEIDIEKTPGAAEEVVRPNRQARYPPIRRRRQVGATVSPRRGISL